MKSLKTFLLITGFLLTNNLVKAQNRLTLEFRPGVNFLTRDLVKTNLETGYGFEGTIAYRFKPHLGSYAGWVWNKFFTDQSFAETNVDFKETGYTFGLQYIHPFGNSKKINYLIRGGGIYNQIEVENNNGDTIADSGYGWGWQIESGLAFTRGKRWRLMPSVRYRSLSRDVKIEEVITEVNLNYLSAGIGLTWFL